MKYYVYISDAKVDMLYPQVPHSIKKKVATEFGVDLRILKASRKAETESEENRITRLETILSFIHEYGRVGSIDNPDEYIEDVLSMSFVDFTKLGAIYLSGETKETALGLAGSARHLIGAPPAEPVDIKKATSSMLWRIVQLLETVDEKNGPGAYESWMTIVDRVDLLGQYPKERLQFFAKRLAFGLGSYHAKVLLASPLYIAKAD